MFDRFSSGSVQASSSPASSRNKEKKVAELKPVVQEHDDDDDEEEVVSGYVEEKIRIIVLQSGAFVNYNQVRLEYETFVTVFFN